jgi:hypothetical protein
VKRSQRACCCLNGWVTYTRGDTVRAELCPDQVHGVMLVKGATLVTRGQPAPSTNEFGKED